MRYNNSNLLEGENVILEKCPNGTRINVQLPVYDAVSGDPYEGYFKVIASEENELKIVNGADEEDDVAGYATVTSTNFTVEPMTLSTTTGGFVYLQWKWNSASNSLGDPTFEYSETYPEYESEKVKVVLATFTTDTVSDGETETEVISSIYQQQHGCINVTDSYSGYFKVIQSGDAQLKIVNGANTTDNVAGYATINATDFTVSSAIKDVEASGFLYLQWVWSSNTIQTPTLEVSATRPAYESNKTKIILATFTVASSKITNIYQQQFGCINSIILGACT